MLQASILQGQSVAGCGRLLLADSDHTRRKDGPLSPRTQMIVLWGGNEANSFGPATSGHLGAGLCYRMGYHRYPPLKRWAMVARPYGAGGADARALGRQPKSAGRQRLAQRFIAGEPGAKGKSSPVRDERRTVATRPLCAATASRPHPCCHDGAAARRMAAMESGLGEDVYELIERVDLSLRGGVGMR